MLELHSSVVTFEPDTSTQLSESSQNVTNNYYDAATSMICTMRNNGGLGFTCKSSKTQQVINTRIRDKGPSTLVKVSPNGKFALIQRQTASVDFIFMDKMESGVAVEFNIPTKSKEPIFSAEWIGNSQLLLMTKQCMELITINESKHSAKLLRSTNISSTWAVFYAPSNLVIAATGSQCLTLQPMVIHHGQFTRLKSFDIDFGMGSTDNLFEKDVSIASIYGKLYVLILRYSVRSTRTSDLALYELTSDVTVVPKLKYTLSLGLSGAFGVHIMDNLIVVHHQSTGRSLIFDVGLAPNRPSHSALMLTTIQAHPQINPSPVLYPPYWHIFYPNVIADALAGMMYRLSLRCDLAINEISDKCALLEFLINRSNQEMLTVRLLSQCIKERWLKLRQIRKLFTLLAEKYSTTQIPVLKPTELTKSQLVAEDVNHMRIEQQTMVSSVFFPLTDDRSMDQCFLSSVMLQYLRSLNQFNIPIDNYFLELVVETCVSSGELTKLHQLVTYRVITDLKALAILLVRYEARCSQLSQSGVDILARQKATVEIVEVLLGKGLIIEAVRFLDTHHVDGMKPKFLEACKEGDRLVQYAVVSHMSPSRRESMTSSRYTEEELEKTSTLLCTAEIM